MPEAQATNANQAMSTESDSGDRITTELRCAQAEIETLRAALAQQQQIEQSLRGQVKAAQVQERQFAKANEALRRTGDRLAHESDLKAFLGYVILEAAQQLGAAAGHFTVLQPERNTLSTVATVLEGRLEIQPFPPEVSVDASPFFEILLQSRQPRFFNLVEEAHLFWPGTLAFHQEQGHQSIVAFALRLNEQPIGHIGLAFREQEQVAEQQMELFQSLAQQATLAIQLTRLAEEAKQAAILKKRERAAQERAAELAKANNVLKRAVGKLSEQPELQAFLGHVLTEAAEQIGACSNALFSYDKATHTLSMKAIYLHGQIVDIATDPRLETFREVIPADLSPSWNAIQSGWIVTHEMAATDPNSFPQAPSFHREMGHETVVAVPLVVGGQVIGFMAPCFREWLEPNPEKIELVQALAHQATLALELTRLAEEAKQTALIKVQEKAAQDRAAELEQVNTHLPQALDQLAESEERYRTLFELSSEGFHYAKLDPPFPVNLPIEEQFKLFCQNLRLEEVNSAFAAMYGVENPEDLTGLEIADFHVEDSEKNRKFIRTVLENNYRVRNVETEEIDAQGQQRYFLNNIVANIKDGYVVDVWGAQIDVTELRRTQQALLQAEQERTAELTKAKDALKQSLDVLAKEPDLDKFLGHVLGVIANQFQAPITEYWYHPEGDIAHIGLMSRQGQTLDREEISQVFPTHPGLTGFRVPPELMGVESLQQRKECLIYEDHSTNSFTKHCEWIAAVGLYKEINVPMVLGDTCIGALIIRLPREHQVTAQQIELAQALVHQASLAVQLTRLAEEAKQAAIAREQEKAAQQRVSELARANATLRRSLSWLTHEGDLSRFLKQVLLEIAATLQADLAYLYVLHPDRMLELIARVIDGELSEQGTPTEPEIFSAAFSVDITPAFRLMEEQNLFLTLDMVTMDPELQATMWPDCVEWHLREGRKQVAALVLKAGDCSVGFLGLGFREQRVFSQEECELVIALSNQVALAIQLTRLAEEAKQAAIAREQEKAAQEQAAKLAKANEELRQRDRLLEATATAADALLTVENFDDAVNTALRIIGESLDTDRVAVIENFAHPSDPSSIWWRILYEWDSAHTIRQITHPEAAQGSYEGIEEWYELFCQGQSFSCLLEEMPEPFRSVQAAVGIKSLHVVPIFVETKFWGVVGFDDCREAKRRNPSEFAVLKIAADCIGSAIQRKRIQQAREEAEHQVLLEREKAAQERAAELAKANDALQSTIDALAVVDDLDEFVPPVLKVVARCFGGQSCAFYDQPGGNWIFLRYWCLDGRVFLPHELEAIDPDKFALIRKLAAGVEVPSDYLGSAIRERNRASIVDHEQGTSVSAFDEFKREHGWEAELNIPLVVDGVAEGALVICRKATSPYTASEIVLAEALAKQLALALQLARLSERAKQAAIAREQEKAAQERAAELTKANEALQQRDCLLSVVAQITKDLLETEDVDTAIPAALRAVGEVANISRVSLILERQDPFSQKRQHCVAYEWVAEGCSAHASVGMSVMDNEKFQVLIQPLYAGRSIWRVVDDLPEVTRAQFELLEIKSTGVVPIFIEGHYLGCVGFDDCVNPRHWTQQEIDVLTAAADSIGAALHRKQLVERLIEERARAAEERSAELAKANEALKRSLNQLAEDSDLDSFLGHVLLEITQQAGASRGYVFLFNATANTLELHLSVNAGRVHLGAVADEPGLFQSPFSADITPAFSAMCQTRQIYQVNVHDFDGPAWPGTLEWHRRVGDDEAAALALMAGEQPVGMLGLAFEQKTALKPEELELIYALAHQAALAIQLTRLADRAKQAAQQATLQEERNRMAREIHDTLAQALTSIILQLEAANRIVQEQPQAAQTHIVRASKFARAGLAEARRSVRALRPGGLEDHNLTDALQRYLHQKTAGTQISAEFQVQGTPRPLPPDLESELLRIAQEATTNVLKHAEATRLDLELSFSGHEVRLCVRDNGKGLDLSLPRERDSFGLISMQERAERISGGLTIVSSPGEGTQVVVVVAV
ncbi:GAF domain-containing protein [Leptolyngbya sp. FACHB-261]|uniref:GAF domain-containing protein n=1 Tax=Leptolyngbya sp. FACHB-261 TaxID=2692806 RepID=UPI0016838CB1|nr:GAF domain-containing protein [Leptolyngbya sp. FACHB-261]MBD2103957.1 GAF domain-containing protein [Leptolyngbya sp. FACHB-261]